MTKERIVYIDTAKTICIFLMVLGHWTTNDVLIKYIYSFHMPALFVISGYLYKPRPWTKTLLSFGIPVAFFSLINLFFLLFIGEVKINQLISLEILCRFFHYRYGLGEGLFMGDWFLWALLGLRLLFGDINFLTCLKRFYLIILVIVVLFLSFNDLFFHVDTIYRGWYFLLMIPSLPFFCFGILLKNINWNPNLMSYYCLLILIVLFFVIPMLNGSCSINSQEYGYSYVLFFINASLSTILLFGISIHIPSNSFCVAMSKGTLLILGIHMPLLNLLSVLLPSFLNCILPILVMILCYYPIVCLDRWCPLLLGKMK